MKRFLYALLFCGTIAAPFQLRAEDAKLPEPIPQRLLREVLADQKQLAPAAVEMVSSLEESERTKLLELCRTDREAARSAILNKLGEKKLQKMQAAEAIRETARLCRQEKDEAKKAELRAKNCREMTGSFECMGDTRLRAGTVLRLTGWGGFDTDYMVQQATHSLSRDGGYRTGVELVRALDY